MASPTQSSVTVDDALSRLQDVHNALGDVKGPLSQDTRLQALSAARNLVAALEKPEEVVMQYGFELGSHRMCIRVAIDLRIFHILVEWNGNPVTAEQLAGAVGAEQLLIVRIMRVLTAIGFAAETGKQTYVMTSLTTAVTVPALEASIKICHDMSSMVEMRMHEYFRVHGYACPTDCRGCAFQWTFQTKQTYFEYLHERPELMKALNTFMTGNRGTRYHWTEWFPVESELMKDRSGSDSDRAPLIVDLGGGRGHDLEKFLKSFPASKDRLVLQDLPHTIADLPPLSPGIRAMAHDFFKEQPIKGARIYYTHFVLHDWPDSECRKILQNTKAAVRPGYSRVFLNESIVPDSKCPSFFAAGDINMMAIQAGIKRTKGQWIELVESVGLKVAKIWTSPYVGDEEGIIEAVLDQEMDIPV